MKISRKGGRLLLRWDAAEVELLGSLFDQLESVLDGALDADDAVLQRLNPSAYPDDEEADREFRGLTATALGDQRRERLAACRAALADGAGIDLAAPDTGRQWMQLLNDLRLALGTRLGVTEEYEHDLDPTDPETPARAVYLWLTEVQDAVVRALLR